jgi:peptidoglycan hydrolase CwlO-like protein
MVVAVGNQLALLRASKDRERDTKRMEANRADTEEVMQLRDQLRTAELRLTDRTSELDDLRRRMAIVQDQHDKEKTRLQDRVTALESQVQRAEIVITQLRADLAAAQAAARAGPASSSSAISALPHSSQTPMKSTRSFVASTAPAVGGSTGNVCINDCEEEP